VPAVHMHQPPSDGSVTPLVPVPPAASSSFELTCASTSVLAVISLAEPSSETAGLVRKPSSHPRDSRGYRDSSIAPLLSTAVVALESAGEGGANYRDARGAAIVVGAQR